MIESESGKLILAIGELVTCDLQELLSISTLIHALGALRALYFNC